MLNYTDWPGRRSWTIAESTTSDMELGDKVTFQLDTSFNPSKVYIDNVTCPGGTSHTPAHTGTRYKGVRCRGTSNQADSASFTIVSSTNPDTNQEMVTCFLHGNIRPASWTAIDGSGGQPCREPGEDGAEPKG